MGDAEMARILSRGERVRILVRGSDARARTPDVAQSGVDLKQIDFVRARTDRSWTRDFLPIFVTRASGRKRNR